MGGIFNLLFYHYSLYSPFLQDRSRGRWDIVSYFISEPEIFVDKARNPSPHSFPPTDPMVFLPPTNRKPQSVFFTASSRGGPLKNMIAAEVSQSPPHRATLGSALTTHPSFCGRFVRRWYPLPRSLSPFSAPLAAFPSSCGRRIAPLAMTSPIAWRHGDFSFLSGIRIPVSFECMSSFCSVFPPADLAESSGWRKVAFCYFICEHRIDLSLSWIFILIPWISVFGWYHVVNNGKYPCANCLLNCRFKLWLH